MGTVALIISAILGAFFVYGLIYTVLQPREPEKGTLRHTKAASYIGSICGLLFLIPSVICAFEKDNDVYVSIGFLAFAVLGAVLVIAYMNTKITYDDTTFTYRDFFGRTSRYDYADITSLDVNTMDVTIRVGKKKISVEMISIGFEDFLSKVNKGYRHHHKKSIPPIEKEKDLFHGHIKDTEGFIFAFILVGVVCIAFIVLCFHMTFSGNDESTTELRETVFISYRYDDNDLMLQATDGLEYEVRDFDEQTDIESITSLCDSGEAVSVYCKKVNPKNGDDYYNAKAIRLGDDFILTFDETNRLTRNANMPLIPVSIGFLILWVIFCILSVIVGRNPEKYKKLAPLLFDKRYIKH